MNQKKILRHVAFLQKCHISANKSCRQVFNLRCTLTKLMSHDEVTGLDGSKRGKVYKKNKILLSFLCLSCEILNFFIRPSPPPVPQKIILSFSLSVLSKFKFFHSALPPPPPRSVSILYSQKSKTKGN